MSEPQDVIRYYAHSTNSNSSDWQLLKDHLHNTASIASHFAMKLGLENIAYTAGFLHDLGKYSSAFQSRIRGFGPPTDHSTAGAQEIIKLTAGTPEQLIAKLIAFCIAGHHTGLPDFGTIVDLPSDSTLLARLKRELEPYSNYKSELDLAGLPILKLPCLHKTTSSGLLSVSFLVRMLYSTLVDADYLETETFVAGQKARGNHPTLTTLNDTLCHHLGSTPFTPSPLNNRRNQILKECLSHANAPSGLFSLTVPTGGGKTLSSLSFALSHAIRNNLDRIIYVIPFTTIIEQNAGIFKKILGQKAILEHHSNFDWDSLNHLPNSDDPDESVAEKLKLASENWDIPITVTTNVQFFESIYNNRSSRCRKIHNIAKSVIIFDEVQALPREFIQPCMLSICELVRNYGSTAVLCTATQPELQRFFPPDQTITEIISNPSVLYDEFKRIRLINLNSQTDQEVIDRIESYNQALCVVNTRRHANQLFSMLTMPGGHHLSTLMYPNHRKRVINQIRSSLSSNEPCRLISTQLIEAGVDLDFPVGFRALAGLDSIIQTGGRVNRNRKAELADLFVFEPITPAIKKLPGYIAQTADVTNQVLRKWQGRDPISLEAIKRYYQTLYSLQNPLSAFDTHGIVGCFEKINSREPNFDFATAADRFKLIGDDTIPIIIPLEDPARQILHALRYAQHPGELLRRIQNYSVNVYRHEFHQLFASGKIEMIQDQFPVLLNPEEDYDEHLGLLLSSVSSGDALFYDL